jgi:hypothetical protein
LFQYVLRIPALNGWYCLFLYKIKKIKEENMILRTFNGLTQQLFDKPFKDMLFTIYNFAEEERYTDNISKLGYDSDIDNLEFAMLDKVDGVNLNDFKRYIESEVQNDNAIIGILLIDSKKGKIPVVIKPKNVDITSILKG